MSTTQRGDVAHGEFGNYLDMLGLVPPADGGDAELAEGAEDGREDDMGWYNTEDWYTDGGGMAGLLDDGVAAAEADADVIF